MSEIRKLEPQEFGDFLDIGINAYPGWDIGGSKEERERAIQGMVKNQQQDPTVDYYGLFRGGRLLGGMRLHHFTMNFLQTEIKAGERDHFVLIQAAKEQAVIEKAPYTVTVEILDVEDPAELVDKGQGRIGNDTIDTADALLTSADPADATVAKIGYRGDVDWYAVSVTDPTTPQVLEVFLDTNSEPSYVDYYVSILRDDVIKKLFDTNGGDGGTELKTSVLIPALTSPTPVTYFLRVSDYQGDDGDGDGLRNMQERAERIHGTLRIDTAAGSGTTIEFRGNL